MNCEDASEFRIVYYVSLYNFVSIPEMQEAELMYKLFDLVSGSLEEINEYLLSV